MHTCGAVIGQTLFWARTSLSDHLVRVCNECMSMCCVKELKVTKVGHHVKNTSGVGGVLVGWGPGGQDFSVTVILH